MYHSSFGHELRYQLFEKFRESYYSNGLAAPLVAHMHMLHALFSAALTGSVRVWALRSIQSMLKGSVGPRKHSLPLYKVL